MIMPSDWIRVQIDRLLQSRGVNRHAQEVTSSAPIVVTGADTDDVEPDIERIVSALSGRPTGEALEAFNGVRQSLISSVLRDVSDEDVSLAFGG